MTKSSNLLRRNGRPQGKQSISLWPRETGDGRREVRHYGSIGGDLVVLDQAVRKLQATGKVLHFV